MPSNLRQMDILLLLFLLVNVIAFTTIGYDKRLAVKNKRRISEKALLLWVVIGGTIGSLLGMLLFRHKISKGSYLLKFFLIVVLQVFLIVSFNAKMREVFSQSRGFETQSFRETLWNKKNRKLQIKSANLRLKKFKKLLIDKQSYPHDFGVFLLQNQWLKKFLPFQQLDL